MLRIMNQKNVRDQIADADTAEGPIERVMREEIVATFKHLKIRKAPRQLVVYAEMILASWDGEIGVLMEVCHDILF